LLKPTTAQVFKANNLSIESFIVAAAKSSKFPASRLPEVTI
jgi:hypothetical protein